MSYQSEKQNELKKMSEEKLIYDENDSLTKNYREIIREMNNEQNLVRDFIFSNIIKLINQKERFMLGPEKTKAASFIADNYQDVHNLLNKLLKSNDVEGLD